jgi:8-oxo-dGTP pyrophosphatase MutT (NUDIX family)
VPHDPILDVMLILTRDDHVLLAQRQGTGYADGQWNLPSGKVEPGEHAMAAIVREAREEIGIRLDPATLRPVGAVHYRNPEGRIRVGLFFATEADPARQGQPVNAEPHKCAKIDWFPLDMLPHDTVPYNAAGIGLHLRGEPLALAGWPDHPDQPVPTSNPAAW